MRIESLFNAAGFVRDEYRIKPSENKTSFITPQFADCNKINEEIEGLEGCHLALFSWETLCPYIVVYPDGSSTDAIVFVNYENHKELVSIEINQNYRNYKRAIDLYNSMSNEEKLLFELDD